MKYRKKPVVIEAMLWDTTDCRGMYNFLESTTDSESMSSCGNNFYMDHDKVEGGLIIKTLDGEHMASIGDYIIKGVKGEFYPCKPDIFEATYEAVEEEG